MKNFIPDIVVADGVRPQIGSLEERFGGRPFGFPSAKWPICSECGGQMTFLAQFNHEPVRLDLGKPGRSLFVFMCNQNAGACETWDQNGGANACLILEPEENTGAETAPLQGTPEGNGVLVKDWIEREDGISPEDAEKFYTEESWINLPQDIFTNTPDLTHLGGVPIWMQSPDEGPGKPWRFVGQIDCEYSFFSPPCGNPNAELPGWIQADPENREGRSHFAEGPDLGDGGLIYLFVKDTEGEAEGLMFWQCA